MGNCESIDHGSYPFVTSSNTSAGAACTGSGVGPTNIQAVIGIAKAYLTRVGAGPFPTELHDAAGDKLRQLGGEFGTTTGRPRRCGWLDIPLLKRACALNGVTHLCLSKLDVLSSFEHLALCVDYDSSNQPIYETLAGWNKDISGCTDWDALPDTCKTYIQRIEDLANCSIVLIGTGADRTHNVIRTSLFKK